MWYACVFVCVAACVLQMDQKRPGAMPLVFPYVNNPAQPLKLTPLVEATMDQSKLPLVAPDQPQRAKLAQKSRRIKSNYVSGQEYEQQREQREREQWEQQREQREQKQREQQREQREPEQREREQREQQQEQREREQREQQRYQEQQNEQRELGQEQDQVKASFFLYVSIPAFCISACLPAC